MLYTGKGDSGTTKLFTSPSGERLSKSAPVFYALGSVDRLNSLLGVCRAKAGSIAIENQGKNLGEIIRNVQEDLFVVQAEIAGSDMGISSGRLSEVENIIDGIEGELPKIESFLIPGETEIGSLLDYARAVSRDTEREVIRSREQEKLDVSSATLAYLNRLSSLLYALARLSNSKLGGKESAPTYSGS